MNAKEMAIWSIRIPSIEDFKKNLKEESQNISLYDAIDIFDEIKRNLKKN